LKIYLDSIIFDLQKVGGASSYFAGLAAQLRSAGEDLVFVKRTLNEQNLFHAGQERVITNSLYEKHLPLFLQRFLPVAVRLEPASIFHSSYYRTTLNKSVASIITVYDCIYEKFRTGLPKTLHVLQKRIALRAADGIICISESTKNDLENYYPWVASKPLRVIPLAVDKEFTPFAMDNDAHNLSSDYNELDKKKYVLYVGERIYRKNFSIAVETVAAFPDKILVLAGGGSINRQEILFMERFIPGRYRVFCQLSLHDLNYLYNNAYCLLYPSKYEVFGLPVLEAMQAGCTVVSTNVSSIPEVAGDAGLLVDDVCCDAFVDKLQRLEDASFRDKVICAGLEQAKKFSWEKTCQQTVEFYKDVLINKFGEGSH